MVPPIPGSETIREPFSSERGPVRFGHTGFVVERAKVRHHLSEKLGRLPERGRDEKDERTRMVDHLMERERRRLRAVEGRGCVPPPGSSGKNEMIPAERSPTLIRVRYSTPIASNNAIIVHHPGCAPLGGA